MADDFEINPQSEAFGDYLAQLGKTPAAAPVVPVPAPAIVAPQIRPQPVDKVAPLPAVVAAEPPTVRDYIADRLSKKDEELKSLQEQSAQDRKIAGVTEGVGQMIAGLSHSAQPFNPGGYQFLQDNAKQPVQDYLQRQDARAKATQGAAAEQKFQREAALEDPGSVQSHVARNQARALIKSVGGDVGMVSDDMSAADVGALKDPIDLMARLKSHRDEMALRYTEAHAKRDEAKSDKAKNEQNKALGTVQTLLESARGNPAAAQAERDIYAAQKADSLANLYGDPNKLSPEMVRILQSEVGKIAQGGAPTMHELEGLDVRTMPKALASVIQRFSNEPSAANAGAFVKQYQDYAHALTKDAQKVISDKYERVIESNKERLGDENYKSLRTHYIDRFPKEASTGGVTPFSDPGKEKRYQEWKAKQGGQ